MYKLHNYLLVLALNVIYASAELNWPQFSWDTVPIFIHMCNASGPFNQEALQFFTRFPLITIEKGQGVNATQEPYKSNYAEDNIIDVCSAVKKLRPNITCIFYYNSINDWTMYWLHEIMAENPGYWLRDDKGEVVLTSGDHHFPQPSQGMLVFDFRQQEVVDLFAQECINLTIKYPGIIDGCFVDKPNQNAFDKQKYNFTQEDLDKFQYGHNQTMLQTQSYLNKTNNSILISNNLYVPNGIIATQLQGFIAYEPYMLDILQWTQRGVLVEARMNGEKDNCTDITDSLAAFLMVAEKYSYYGCSSGWFVQDHWLDWHQEYDKPLGPPLGPGIKINNTWYRQFASGTNVTLKVLANGTMIGNIQWSQ